MAALEAEAREVRAAELSEQAERHAEMAADESNDTTTRKRSATLARRREAALQALVEQEDDTDDAPASAGFRAAHVRSGPQPYEARERRSTHQPSGIRLSRPQQVVRLPANNVAACDYRRLWSNCLSAWSSRSRDAPIARSLALSPWSRVDTLAGSSAPRMAWICSSVAVASTTMPVSGPLDSTWKGPAVAPNAAYA